MATLSSSSAKGGGARSSSSLLPQEFEQFGSKKYWESFFHQRREKAFEWYGTYRDLRRLVTAAIHTDERILVIGCGNSDFSLDLYTDGGYHDVTNVDFSEGVIKEMKTKAAARSCPNMRWLVMDVTDMRDGFVDGSFDVVVDKGTLDAIFHTPENEAQASRMLEEVSRVLTPNRGRYLCVTLGQDFILRKLLDHFRGERGWHLALYMIEQQPQPQFRGGPVDPSSAYLTLFIVATRQTTTTGGTAGGAASMVSLYFDRSARPLADPLHILSSDVHLYVTLAQERYRSRFELREVKAGRFQGDIDVWSQEQQQQGHQDDQTPRYTISIVDNGPAALPCGVFLIPQGREHEWLFSTPDGLRQVAESSDYSRLICVRMNRGHQFENMEKVQAELSPIVLDFVPAGCNASETPVPFLTIGDSIGSRTVLESGELPMCGKYSVEEEMDDEDGPLSGARLRKLVFLRNQNVIQSEVRLVPSRKQQTGGGKKGGKGGKKGGKAGKVKKASSKGAAAEDDEAHTTMSAPSLVLDYTYMCFDYHKSMLAGLGLMSAPIKAARGAPRGGPCCLRALVIGLGGGALPMFLRRLCPVFDVTVVELEGGLVQVASKWFGFQEEGAEGQASRGGLRVEVGDGIERIVAPDAAEETWDLVVVDADNSDPSTGISCPSPGFLSSSFLTACKGRLSSHGMLVMNVAARSADKHEEALGSIKAVFIGDGEGELYTARPTEHDINCVVFALRSKRPASAARVSMGLHVDAAFEGAIGFKQGELPLELDEMVRMLRLMES